MPLLCSLLSCPVKAHTYPQQAGSSQQANGSAPATAPAVLSGDPTRQDLSVQEMCWTISCDQETVVTAFPIQNPHHPSWGYALQEADR